MKNRKAKIILFGILSFIMGATAGTTIWAVLQIMNGGTTLLWKIIPNAIGIADRTAICDGGYAALVYDIAVCTTGGILIGSWQKHHGVFPETLETIIEKVKTDGGYPYNKIHTLLVAALLPLIFGGAVGPEAGLTGIIAGLCTMIGDRLKYKGDEVKKIAEAGLAATLGVIFTAPLFGIVGNIEKRDWNHGRICAPAKGRKPLLSIGGRTVIYIFAVIGAMLSIKMLSALLGGMAGLPRFNRQRMLTLSEMLSQWKWVPLLLLAGIFAAILYAVFDKLTMTIGRILYKHQIISCAITGILLGIAGHFCASGRFSGEAQMENLIESWQSFTVITLLIMGLVKLLMVNICINMGWKGGTIFPMIYSAVAIGYACAALIGTVSSTCTIEGTFAVAVVAASMLGFLMRKPVTVVAVLLLCFPLTFLPALIITSFLSSLLGRFAEKITVKGNTKKKQRVI